MFAFEKCKDPVTELDFIYLTPSDTLCRKMYFSGESFTADDSRVLIFCFPPGGAQLVELEIGTGRERVLADAADGWNIHSFGLAREIDEGYIIKGNEVYALNISSGETQALASLPERAQPCGHYTAGKSGLLPMTFKLANGIFCLALTDPAKGTTELLYYSDTPLGHCQACPGDDNTVFFCHETGGDALQRMWHFDIAQRRAYPYYVERWGEWITHEAWSADGRFMTFIKAPDEIWTGTADGRNFRLVSKSKEYHHCAPSRSMRWIVSDRSKSGEVVLVDAGTGSDTLLVTGHKPTDGADHQHPSFNRAGDKVLFSAPSDGSCRVGLIDLNQIEGFKP